MSAVVLTFPKAQEKAKAEPPVRKFYCLNCDGGAFAIHAEGGIFCLGCKAVIKNLRAVEL